MVLNFFEKIHLYNILVAFMLLIFLQGHYFSLSVYIEKPIYS